MTSPKSNEGKQSFKYPGTPEAIARCPTGAIVWVEGAQFASIRELAGSEAG